MTGLNDPSETASGAQPSVKRWVRCPYCDNTAVDIEVWGGTEVVFNCDRCNNTGTFSVE